jgi:hypothetical protein
MEFADDWVSSWNAHDIDRIISHYSERLEFYSPLIVERYDDPKGLIQSREKLKEYFQMGLTKNPNLSFKLLNVLVGVNQVTLYYENARGGITAELFEFNEDGLVVRSSSCYD